MRQTAMGTRQGNWYGMNQYLFYKINCCWTAGLRFEWFRDEDGFVVTGLRPGNPMSASSSLATSTKRRWASTTSQTATGTFARNCGTTGSMANGQPYDDNSSKRQFLFGLDAIYQF